MAPDGNGTCNFRFFFFKANQRSFVYSPRVCSNSNEDFGM
jgi:hypothetical protein